VLSELRAVYEHARAEYNLFFLNSQPFCYKKNACRIDSGKRFLYPYSPMQGDAPCRSLNPQIFHAPYSPKPRAGSCFAVRAGAYFQLFIHHSLFTINLLSV
jgi:hypothetical protein